MLFEYANPQAEEILASIGIKGTEAEIKNKIKQKRTKLKVELAKRATDEREKSDNDYYKMIAIAGERRGHHIPADISLAEWCGILTTLKETNGR